MSTNDFLLSLVIAMLFALWGFAGKYAGGFGEAISMPYFLIRFRKELARLLSAQESHQPHAE